MTREQIKKSIVAGFNSLKCPFGVFGTLMAVISTTHLVVTLLDLSMASEILFIYEIYTKYVHGLIEITTAWTGWVPPSWCKDIVVIYFLIGGFFMRARTSEGIYDSDSPDTILQAFRNAFRKSRVLPEGGIPAGSRMTVLYQRSPKMFKKVLDTSLWPRVASQYFSSPSVYFHEYSATIQTFESGYTPGPRKEYLHDRRLVLLVQAIAVAFGVTVFIVTNTLLKYAN